MRLLLDTHTFIWWELDDPRLSTRARDLLSDTANLLTVSAVVAWEIGAKTAKRKLPEADMLVSVFDDLVRPGGDYEPLAISHRHALASTSLPRFHRDPFDRMLVAQAFIEGMTLVSRDEDLSPYGVPRLW